MLFQSNRSVNSIRLHYEMRADTPGTRLVGCRATSHPAASRTCSINYRSSHNLTQCVYFADKKLSCSEETSKCQLPGLSTRITDTEDPGSGTTSVASHRTLVNVEGQSESALGRTRDVDPNGDCLYSASQYGPHFSSGSHSADR